MIVTQLVPMNLIAESTILFVHTKILHDLARYVLLTVAHTVKPDHYSKHWHGPLMAMHYFQPVVLIPYGN